MRNGCRPPSWIIRAVAINVWTRCLDPEWGQT